MAMRGDFSWTEFYKEFATKLVAYSENRVLLVETIKKVFSDIGITLPTLELNGDVYDIDPFTTFGLFNKGITDENRIKIITAFASALNISATIPTKFDGIPVLMNQSATFYYFEDKRGAHDIDNLWSVFLAGLNYADNPLPSTRENFITAFDTVLKQKGIKWNITMGLYWVRPNYYINLDTRNRWFIQQPNLMSSEFVSSLPDLKKVPDGSKYLDLCEDCAKFLSLDTCEFETLPELSVAAWTAVTENDKIVKDTDNQEKAFREWMASQVSVSGEIVTETTVSNNALAIRKVCSEIALAEYPLIKNLFSVTDLGLFLQIREAILKHPDYPKVNKKHGNGYLNSALTIWYERFLQCQKDVADSKKNEEDKSSSAHDSGKIIPGDDSESLTPYVKNDFLNDVYMTEINYSKLIALLTRKKNIILQGAPGVGKTYAAKRLAYSMMGSVREDHVAIVQFHQNYTYEDFIMGYKPTEIGFTLKTGIFYNFCSIARDNPHDDYFFIIDEINRGNMSKIFGELLMLIESDYRDTETTLAYDGEPFSVPGNLYIIGMMNTADRSLALIDYALRRRFSFFELEPGFDSDGFKAYMESLNSEKFNLLIDNIKQLNNEISADKALGRGFCIGHSYFCNQKACSDEWLLSVIEYDILPTLAEYWFDNPGNYNRWDKLLHEVLK